ncbi:MAG: NADH-quinone oxidoreductase subunit A [Deltaproteobacteria bacterium]|nr:NADH-quinone oxidoreductase subunit A [Deltaproteobacteria bacterium]
MDEKIGDEKRASRRTEAAELRLFICAFDDFPTKNGRHLYSRNIVYLFESLKRILGLEKHVPNLVAALWGFGFFALLLAGSKLVRPDRKSDAARSGFNSGERNSESPWIRMSARYHLLVAAATTFFLGVLILYPAVATFRQWLDEGHGVVALAAVGVFLGTLSVALAYAWMKGDLSWIRDKEENGNPRERVS